MQLNKTIQSRKSVRKFATKKPDWRTIIECIDAARFAPMAGNNYTLKFILIDDKKTIQKLADAAQQPFIAQAHYVVVACTNPTRTVNLFKKRGEIYCRQQAGAAIQNFLLKIQETGLSTCWIGHFVDHLIKKELKIPENINVEAFFPIGYETKVKGQKSRKKPKVELDRILYFHKYDNKKMNGPKTLDV